MTLIVLLVYQRNWFCLLFELHCLNLQFSTGCYVSGSALPPLCSEVRGWGCWEGTNPSFKGSQVSIYRLSDYGFIMFQNVFTGVKSPRVCFVFCREVQYIVLSNIATMTVARKVRNIISSHKLHCRVQISSP